MDRLSRRELQCFAHSDGGNLDSQTTSTEDAYRCLNNDEVDIQVDDSDNDKEDDDDQDDDVRVKNVTERRQFERKRKISNFQSRSGRGVDNEVVQDDDVEDADGDDTRRRRSIRSPSRSPVESENVDRLRAYVGASPEDDDREDMIDDENVEIRRATMRNLPIDDVGFRPTIPSSARCRGGGGVSSRNGCGGSGSFPSSSLQPPQQRLTPLPPAPPSSMAGRTLFDHPPFAVSPARQMNNGGWLLHRPVDGDLEDDNEKNRRSSSSHRRGDDVIVGCTSNDDGVDRRSSGVDERISRLFLADDEVLRRREPYFSLTMPPQYFL